MRFLLLARILIGLILLTFTVSGQLRLDPQTQELDLDETISFRIIGAIPGASLFVSVSYPTMGERDWMTATRVGDRVDVTTLPKATNLKTGTYLGYVSVVMNGTLVARATVKFTRIRDEVRYRFYSANQLITGNQIDITSASSTVTIQIDYNGNAGVVPNKPFRLVAESSDPASPWLDANPKTGATGLTTGVVTMTVDARNLASRSAPYTGVVLVYDPAKPDDQSSLLVNLMVTGTPPGTRLTQGMPTPYSLATPGLANGERGYWVDVPQGSGRLRVEASGTSPISIHARWEQEVGVDGSLILADASSAESTQPVLELTQFTSPALKPGRYYIALNLGGGTSTGYIAYEITATGAPGLSNPVIAQIAAGAEWKTTILLVNKGDSPSTFSLRFRDSSGVNWPVALLRLGPNQADLGTLSTLTDTIPAGGFYTYQTREQPQAAVRQGYAELVSGAGIAGQAIFQQAAAGGFDYEAASPMALGAKRFALPFDNVAADGINTVTSMALVNSATVGATVTARIRDELGQLQDTRMIQMTAGQHRAETLTALLGNAVQNRRGLVEFESNGPDITALGLRFRRPFTSFPTVPVGAAPGSEGALMISQIAAGADWKTTIILVNSSETPQNFTLRFRDQSGFDWPLALRRVGPDAAVLGATASLSATIPAWGTITYQSVDAPQAAVRSGYAQVSSGGGVRGLAIFQQRSSAGFDYEAAVQLQPAVRRFILPFDNVGSGGRVTQTGLAMANPSPNPNPVNAKIRDESGQVTDLVSTVMRPWEQFAEQLSVLFGPPVNGRRGTVEFDATGSEVGAVGLRFRGPFSSFAIVPK